MPWDCKYAVEASQAVMIPLNMVAMAQPKLKASKLAVGLLVRMPLGFLLGYLVQPCGSWLQRETRGSTLSTLTKQETTTHG